jgi:diguanylate cyclase (GGDEF)-like protein
MPPVPLASPALDAPPSPPAPPRPGVERRRRRQTRRGRRRTAAVVLVGALLTGALLSPLAVLINQTNNAARRGLEERQASRTVLARQFVDTYVADLLARVANTAEVTVAGAAPTEADLVKATRLLQMDAAVLLDDQGRLLQVAPSRPDLLGQDMTARYAHLRAAVDGQPTVSMVVPSASTGTPIVAFAAPFDTPTGRRVLSGGFTIESTPLGAFLRSFSPISRTAVYLVDSNGRIADTNVTGHRDLLADQDPGLAAAAATGSAGFYTGDGGTRYFVSERVTTAPWQIVVSMPTENLYASIASGNIMPWLLFAAFATASVTSVVLVARVMHQRRQLAHLAERDALTGLYNRRHVDAELHRLTRRGARAGEPTAVLLIDVDHFKRVNDEHGHYRGDEVLQQVADALRASVRTEDVVSRWGGEEFMVVAPDTGLDAAAGLAERLRRAVVDGVAIDGVPVTASVGYAVDTTDAPEAAAGRADRALYRAKEAGRNRVATVELVPHA